MYLIQHTGQINPSLVLYYITYDSIYCRIRTDYFQITFLGNESELKNECPDITVVSTTYKIILHICYSIFFILRAYFVAYFKL